MNIPDNYQAMVERLLKMYPDMFPRGTVPLEISEPGWYTIIDRLCNSISNYAHWQRQSDPDYKFPVVFQIKEKFGGLRFYIENGDDKIYGMINMAEAMCAVTCETCGAPGERRPGGWVKTLCEEHYKEL